MRNNILSALVKLQDDKTLAPFCHAIYHAVKILDNEQAGQIRPPENEIIDPGKETIIKIAKWKGSKAEAVELIIALYSHGSISFDNARATLANLQEHFEKSFRLDLKDFNIIDYNNRARKRADTPFLDKLAASYKGRKTVLG